ncbi:hypothetical protein GCM10027578_09600 [Spirosoma luteolum]
MNTSPFYYQRVSDPAELQRYAVNYRILSGNELPADYLQNAIVYQFYRGPIPVAGFMLNTREMNRLRYFSYLTDGIRDRLLDDENLTEHDLLELTANWKRRDLSARESRIYYTVMLTQAYKHARLLGKAFLVGGSIIKAVKQIQQELMERVIYHGPVGEHCRQSIREDNALLKIYVIELDDLPLQATVVLLNRYLIRATKNRVKQWLSNWRLPLAPKPLGAGKQQTA